MDFVVLAVLRFCPRMLRLEWSETDMRIEVKTATIVHGRCWHSMNNRVGWVKQCRNAPLPLKGDKSQELANELRL